MHRNTFFFISFLAVVAALLIGVNLGKRLAVQPKTVEPPALTSITPSIAREPFNSPQFLTYDNSYCGISLRYPSTLTKVESASASALFTDPAEPGQSFALTCQNDVPLPALKKEFIEPRSVGSVSAYLYHDTNAKDGTPIDKFIFRHPTTDLDVFLAGYGSVFAQIIDSLTIIP